MIRKMVKLFVGCTLLFGILFGQLHTVAHAQSGEDSDQEVTITDVQVNKTTIGAKETLQITVKTTGASDVDVIGGTKLVNKQWQAHHTGDAEPESAVGYVDLEKAAQSTDESQTFKGSYTVPVNAINGEWDLSFWDFKIDQNVKIPVITINGGNDFSNRTKLTLSTNTAKPGDKISVKITGWDLLTDEYHDQVDLSYENQAWAAANKNGYSENSYVDAWLKYNARDGAFEGTLDIPDKAVNGKWNLKYSFYAWSDETLSFSSSFAVNSPYTDVISPDVKDISFYMGSYRGQSYQTAPLYAHRGDQITAVIDAIDNTGGSGINAKSPFISLNYKKDSDGDYDIVYESLDLKQIPGTSKYAVTFPIPEDMEDGTIGLRVWGVEDNSGNGTYTNDFTNDTKVIVVKKSDVYKPVANTSGAYNLSREASFNQYIAQVKGTVHVTIPATAKKNSVSVSLSESQVKAIKKHKNVIIENGAVSLNLPTSDLRDKGAVALTITKNNPIAHALTDVYDFTLTQNGEKIHQFKDKVALMFHLDKKAKNPVVYYVNGNKLEAIDSKYEPDVVYGYTNHFSKYTVAEKSAVESPSESVGSTSADHSANANRGSSKDAVAAGDKQKLPATGDTESIVPIVTGILLFSAGLCLLVFLRRKPHVE